MSDLKLYRILETFDELESATDKLTPVKEGDLNEGDDVKYQGAYDAGVKAAKAGKKLSDINVSDQWAH